MITLHIGKLLEDEGFGVLALTGNEANAEIYWEDIPLDSQGNPKNGVWVVTRSSTVSRLQTGVQAFDIYARYSNKITTANKLEGILNYLRDAYGEVCELPTIPEYSETVYRNVSIEPVSSVENVGSDVNNKIVKVISGIIRYEEEES